MNQTDWNLIWTIVGASIAVISLVYGFLRNFKTDINVKFDHVFSEMKDIRSEIKDVRTDFDGKFERVFSEIKELRTGLNRMEGAFYSKDFCMLREDKDKKSLSG